LREIRFSVTFNSNDSETCLPYLQKQGMRLLLPLCQAGPAAERQARQLRSRPMPRLYRSAAHPHHWIAYSAASGWMLFPAKVRGWDSRRPATGLDPAELFETPLWLSFHTGLWEEVQAEARSAAA
jgi:hypothetical protein